MTEAIPVSIIVRTLGRKPRLLAGALASLATQSYRQLEVMVVEDGSEDAVETVRAANALREIFQHLPIAKCGRSLAGNAGLAAARGEVLGFLDEDDLVSPDHVTTIMKAIECGAQCAYARATPTFCVGLENDEARLASSGDPVGDVPFSRTLLWLRNAIPIQAALFRRSLYERLGGLDPSLTAFEDWDLWIRYSADTAFVALDAVTSRYRLPADRQSLEARAAEHDAARGVFLAKHADLVAGHRFSDIAALPLLLREQTSFRQAIKQAGVALHAKLFGRKPIP